MMNDNRPEKVEIILHGTNGRISNLFRSESELQKEGKGGFLKGQIHFNIDTDIETIERIELSTVSSHESELHCNLLRVSNNSFEKEVSRRDNHVSGDHPQCAMSPSAYKVILIRNDNDTFRIDRTKHDYLPCNGTEVCFFDEKCQTLYLGDKDPLDNFVRRPGLCLTPVKPYSKSDTSKNFVHMREVLKTRKAEELKAHMDEHLPNFTEQEKQQKLSEDMATFEKKQLNCDATRSAANRKKDKIINLETMLSEGEMHKFKLKVVMFTALKLNELHNNKNVCNIKSIREKNTSQEVGYSEWILASNRYGFEIDKMKTNLAILTKCSIQVVTVFLKTCKLTSKMVIEAQFMYRQKAGGEGSIWNTSGKEIKILEVNGTSVHRVGDGKTAIQIYLNNKKGTCLNLTKHGIVGGGNNVAFQLFLKLTIRDESGYIGAEDTVDANCIDHDCSYDQYLAELDDLLNDENNLSRDILKQETIQSRIERRALKFLPCSLCEVLVIPGRRQYLEEKITRDKRRRSNHSSDGPDDWKRSRPFGKAVCYFFRLTLL